MLLVASIVAGAFLLSNRTLRSALPVESLLVVSLAAVTTLTLFQLGQLG